MRLGAPLTRGGKKGSPTSSRPLRGAIPRTAPGPELCPNVASRNPTQHQKERHTKLKAKDLRRKEFLVVVFQFGGVPSQRKVSCRAPSVTQSLFPVL